MSFYLCKECCEWHWSDERCPLRFLVKIPEWDGDELENNWNTVHADSEECAAKEYLEKVDDEFSCLDESISVWVQNPIEQKNLYRKSARRERNCLLHRC